MSWYTPGGQKPRETPKAGSGPVTNVLSFYEDGPDFAKALELATRGCQDQRSNDFVDGLKERFDVYGVKMRLSQAQQDWLCELVGRA